MKNRRAQKPIKTEENKREARHNRILDAAVQLIQRWGYKKTTIEDIAREAGVAKGTIYLHWKTREELLVSLIFREGIEVAYTFRAALGDDPSKMSLYSIIYSFLETIADHPLIWNIVLGDSEIYREISQSSLGLQSATTKTAVIQHFFEMMRTNKIIRTDQAIEFQVKVFSSLSVGFLLANSHLPNELHLSLPEQAQGLADTLQGTFAAPILPSPTAFRETMQLFLQQFDQFLVVAQAWSPKESEQDGNSR